MKWLTCLVVALVCIWAGLNHKAEQGRRAWDILRLSYEWAQETGQDPEFVHTFLQDASNEDIVESADRQGLRCPTWAKQPKGFSFRW